MIDIKLIRENRGLVKENIKKKFQDTKLPLVDQVRELDEQWRKLKAETDELRAERNSISRQISEVKKSGADASDLLKKAKRIPEQIEEMDKSSSEIQDKINEIMLQLPNIISDDTPIGKDASENVVRQVIGKPKKFNFELKSHGEIAEKLGIADFETAAKVSGNGFFYLRGDLALLNQALISYAREFMIKKGYEYIEPPLMIHEKILRGVYSSADIAAQAYKIENEDLYLIATSEHPLIGMFIDKTMTYKQLPIKITGYSMCFRKEIGSHGINEKGLYRTHQFNKQEMIVICEPKDSYKYYDELMNLSKHLFKSLGLPIRELESCSGDLSDIKARGADLEVWSPIQKKYFEITSVTNMEEAQARRLNIKFTDDKGEKKYVHTLNNTAIATSRAMVAILENYQKKDGSIEIPRVLRPYMFGKTKIEAKSLGKKTIKSRKLKKSKR